MKKTIITVMVLFAILVGFTLSNSGTKQVYGEPIMIGVILPITGPVANLGEPMRNVMEIAVSEINAAGGIKGSPIKLIIEDGQCDSKSAANAMQKLAHIDKVAVVIGGACSGESLAAVPIATKAKIALFSPASSSGDLTSISKFFARNFPSDSFQGKVIAEVAIDKGFNKVAFITEKTDYALGLQLTFTEHFEKLGGKTYGEEVQTETNDFRTILAKIRSEKPDAVFVSVQSSVSAEKIFRQMGDINWKPQILVSDPIIGNQKIVSDYSNLLEGAIGAEFSVNEKNQKFSSLMKTYVELHGEEPAYKAYMQTTYDAVFLISEAISKSGYNGEKIAYWLHNVKNWKGASGTLSIGSNGDPIIGHKPEVIKNGKVELY